MKKIALLAILCFNFWHCNTAEAQSKLKPDAFEQLLKTDTSVQLIDVRTPQETANGMIKKAVNINIADADFQTRITKLDKAKPVAVYCAVGGRSGRAATALTQMGYKVYDLEGGMNAWIKQSKHIVKK